jgi:hypothetical protein
MNTSNESNQRFVICIRNDDYEVSLELRKVYQVIPDAEAANNRMLRVTDESGEDYLYPAEFFMSIELPEAVRKALVHAA